MANTKISIKNVYRHVRHARPKWYHDYHKWEHHEVLHWITFAFSAIVMFMGFVNAVLLMQQYPLAGADAATGTTSVTQQVNAGTLGISTTASSSLSSVTVNVTASQNSTGNLGTLTVTDNRGSGVGWSSTATSTDFYKVNAAALASGANNTVTTDATSTYSNSTGGTYTITINAGGAAGVATYTVSGLETQTTTTTGTGVAIGTRGVTATFAAATYVIGDSWTIRVDVIPVTGLQITPGAVTTITGSSTNVTGGSVHTFTSTSDATSLVTASYNYGMGSYSVTPSLQLTVPANSYANTYDATVTETVS